MVGPRVNRIELSAAVEPNRTFCRSVPRCCCGTLQPYKAVVPLRLLIGGWNGALDWWAEPRDVISAAAILAQGPDQSWISLLALAMWQYGCSIATATISTSLTAVL